MDTDLIVDTATLCVVVAIALLFLASRAWQKRKAALSVQSKGTQTDNPVLNIDNTINRLSLELSTLQQHLDSIEQGRLETVTNNRLLSMLPKSAYFNEEDGSFNQDNGIRPSTIDKLAKLRPAFRAGGTVTAANSSFLSDGASACLITTETKARQLGLRPKAYLTHVSYASQDPKEELLLGPAYAIPKVLQLSGTKLSDFHVIELHEAFAGQVLCNLKALSSQAFCTDKLGLGGPLGLIPEEKLNTWGGSVSIGHPFGATGIRILSHAANRLHHEDGQLALVAACAANAQGVAMILERC